MRNLNLTREQQLALMIGAAVVLVVGGILVYRYLGARKAKNNLKAAKEANKDDISMEVDKATKKTHDAIEDAVHNSVKATEGKNEKGTKIRQEIADLLNGTSGKGETAFKNAKGKIDAKMDELLEVEHSKSA